MSLIHFWPGNALRVRSKQPLPTKAWKQVTVTYDGSSQAEGVRLFVDGRPIDTEVVRDHLQKHITGGGGNNITIGQRFRDRGFTGGEIDEFRVFDRQLTEWEVRQLNQRTTASLPEEAGRRHFLMTQSEAYQQALQTLQEKRQAICKLQDAQTEIMVMRERSKPRSSYLLQRGAYDQPGEPVVAATPAVLPPFSASSPRNRLGLAQWLTNPQHPLTARVAVNRLWQLCFGEGLVRTPEDFGSQGALPTHPQLLDWLAFDLIQHEWDLKRTLRLIVDSATYRQSSAVTAAQLKADPENRLWGRSPSYRRSAEMLRDNALAVSGLLVSKTGGAPVRPYEVESSFKPVERGKGSALYRRSLYTYWKRTGPAPVMMALDAAKRDVCRVKRERTSSPLQALVLLNGVQFVEAARAAATRVLEQSPNDPAAAIGELFLLSTSRRPKDRELQILLRLYRTQRDYFAKHPQQAQAHLQTGDSPVVDGLPKPQLAALTVVATSILNFDECVTRR